MKNKKIVWIIIGIVSVALIALAITYAYWQITKTQQGVNEISAACLDITLVDAESGNTGVTLQDQYPLSDEEGAVLKPYKFTVTNNCDVSVDYQIALESTGSSTEALKASSLKVMLDSTTSLLNANETVTPTINGAYASHKLGMGTLAKSGDTGSSVTHELRLWIDEAAPVSENNKTYNGKITVTIGQGIEIKPTLKDTLLAAYGGESAITELNSSAFATATTASDAGMYKMQDDYGTSYYYRGNVTNNYVKFGSYEDGVTINYKTYEETTPIYWRIIRINGDGTIRLAYDGDKKVANAEYHDAYIAYHPFNNEDDNKMYVGYMYGTDEDPYGDNESTVLTDSDIKTTLDAWYEAHFKTKYGSYIADSVFCNDREEAYVGEEDITGDGQVMITHNYYKGYDRLVNSQPTLVCANQRDRFTVDDITLGNGHLTNPIGLITADELMVAGYSNGDETASNYLNFQEYYYTATPYSFDVDTYNHMGTYMIGVPSVGAEFIGGLDYDTSWGVRPVINLKADVEFTIDEDGTYVITTN